MSGDMAGKNGQAADGVHSLNLANQRGISKHLKDILEAVKGSHTTIVPRDENPLIEELRGERETLRQENVKLWNLLGRMEQQSKRLKEDVKLLEGPKEMKEGRGERKRWWTLRRKA